MSSPDGIETERVLSCPSCSTAGVSLYAGVRDHTFGTPGEWAFDRCPSCGLVWLSLRPTPADNHKVYRTYYTHALVQAGSTFGEHIKVRSLSRLLVKLVTLPIRRVKDAVLATRLGYSDISRGRTDTVLAYTLGLLPGMTSSAAMDTLGLSAADRGRILDVGCGNGAFLARMKRLGWQCTGIETDPQAAQFARDSFGLNVLEGELANAGFADDSFDVVTLSHVIEHVHSPLDLLMHCRRVLKPGGKLVVLTPNLLSLGHRIFGRAWRGLEPPRHLQSFHPNALRQVVERSHMYTLRISTESRMMRPIWYASRLIQRADRSQRPRNSLLDYLLAYTMQCVEGVACLFAVDVGEEIVLVATKPTSTPTSWPPEE